MCLLAVVCADGEQSEGADCVQCQQGYYRNSNELQFEPCAACPAPFTTKTTGAVSLKQCTLRESLPRAQPGFY